MVRAMRCKESKRNSRSTRSNPYKLTLLKDFSGLCNAMNTHLIISLPIDNNDPKDIEIHSLRTSTPEIRKEHLNDNQVVVKFNKNLLDSDEDKKLVALFHVTVLDGEIDEVSDGQFAAFPEVDIQKELDKLNTTFANDWCQRAYLEACNSDEHSEISDYLQREDKSKPETNTITAFCNMSATEFVESDQTASFHTYAFRMDDVSTDRRSRPRVDRVYVSSIKNKF